MALSDLCNYDDVISRMADVGLATASEDNDAAVEIIERKRVQADKKIELDLIKKVAKVIAPYPTDFYNHTPAQIVALISDEAKAFLNETAICYTLRAMYEEGDTRLRFRFQEAGDALDKVLKRWDALCAKEFDEICPLLTFDQDGSGTVTLMERLLMRQVSSVRVTA